MCKLNSIQATFWKHYTCIPFFRDDEETWDITKTAKEVGVPLCEGILAFQDGYFSKAVDLIYPIRYQIYNIGGSIAQVKNEEHGIGFQQCAKSISFISFYFYI